MRPLWALFLKKERKSMERLFKRKFAERCSFRKNCYELYQLDWLIHHGFSLNDIFEKIQEKSFQSLTEFGKYLTDNNLTKEIFACEQEFYQCEYQDAEIMKNILPDDMFSRYMFNRIPTQNNIRCKHP